MMHQDGGSATREVHTQTLKADLVVVGGGMAGSCCAITAAREGLQVVLVQDRPVLGGNASSEVRLWILGATSHMGNNNRWAREGGVIDEILVENTYRNPEGNAVIFDTVLLEKVIEEPNITLLLNTAVYETIKSDPDTIQAVTAFCSQNGTRYVLEAPFFCDASGDGIVGFQAGAAFRMGAEASDEFGEPFAPTEEYGELLGHSIYFMTKDLGKPVRFVAPAYALKDITRIPRYRKFNVKDHGCWLWWLEYGGRLDTIKESETIKWELWKVVYGIWDYIKNSGNFPESETMTLEWVGLIPGKRESRRFEGDYMLTQSDIVEQRQFHDAVAHGGWSIDLHPADGVFSEKPGCNQWHSKGVYEIPYRCMYSRNIHNLFLTGRIISSSHVAFGSTRVMGTCAHNGQAVGMAAVLCHAQHCLPADLSSASNVVALQKALLRAGQYIPHTRLKDPADCVGHAQIDASSEMKLAMMPPDGDWQPLTYGTAQLLPLSPGKSPEIKLYIKAGAPSKLTITLRGSIKPFNYTPDIILDEQQFEVAAGEQEIVFQGGTEINREAYYFLCLHQNEELSVGTSSVRMTGIVSLYNKQNVAVSNYGRQDPDPELGFESFEFWVPTRRPDGKNLALQLTPALKAFGPHHISNGILRPTVRPNAWVADRTKQEAQLNLEWNEPQSIDRIIISFDTDWDYAMESCLLGHAESIMPFVVRDYEILDDKGNTVHSVRGNYQTRQDIHLDTLLQTRKLTIKCRRPSPEVPVAIFGVQCYSPG